ncbi:MAG: DNA repair protein RadC [Lachnospiraceae bacterium]|nr:DNA repair protein RadC [Lachnospiraceae bacterium]
MKKQRDLFTMRELPDTERPYERCIQYGAAALTDAQLLAVLLKTGTKEESALHLAQRVLMAKEDREPGIGTLLSMKYPDYLKIHGIGPVKAVTLLCVVELAKRLSLCQKRSQIVFTDSQSVAEYYMEFMRQYDREHFWLLLLDSKNALLKELELSVGTISAALASPREVMIEALRYEAVHFILLHNHPSGNPSPSDADIKVTRKLQQAGELLDIQLLDHIIIGEQQYVSMRANQIL